MNEPHPVLELHASHRAFRWDTGLFCTVALGVVALAFFVFDSLSETATESDLYKYKYHALFSLMNGAATVCAIAMWIRMNDVLERAKVRIENRRVVATVFDGRDNRVGFGINEIHAIEVESNQEGQIVSLSLKHKEGTLELTHYSQLDLLLEAIRIWRPEGIVIREKARRVIRVNLPVLMVTLVAGLTTLATIHVRYIPIESPTPFSQILQTSSLLRFFQLYVVMLSKRGDGDSRAELRVTCGFVLVLALLAIWSYEIAITY